MTPSPLKFPMSSIDSPLCGYFSKRQEFHNKSLKIGGYIQDLEEDGRLFATHSFTNFEGAVVQKYVRWGLGRLLAVLRHYFRSQTHQLKCKGLVR